jgi:tetraacyldisaccharide-1-P 4'-kinase
LAFPDHYRFTKNEFRSVLSRNPDVPVVVTEKDWVKLSAWVKDSGRVCALKIGTRMDDEDAFWNLLERLVWHRYGKPAETGPIGANVHGADHRNKR